MSMHTLMRLNHDYMSEIAREPDQFIAALENYCERPSLANAELLRAWGVHIYGMAHHDNMHTPGFRTFEDKQRYHIQLELVR